MCPATPLPHRSWGHQLAEDTFSHSAQEKTHRQICPLWRQLSFGMHLTGLLCQSASKDRGCVCSESPPACFCFKKKHGCTRGWWIPRSHPVMWREHELGAYQMTMTSGTQRRELILQQSPRKLQFWRCDSGGFWGKGNPEAYRTAPWRGGSSTCQRASETMGKKEGITAHGHFAVH